MLSILPVYLSLFVKVYWKNSQKNKALIAELNDLLIKSNHSLNLQNTKRINAYTVQSTLTNEWFSTLREFPLTAQEQKVALYVGAITPLLDDLTDHLEKTSSMIWNALETIDKTEVSSELILVRYLDQKLKSLGSTEFQDAFKNALDAQDSSLTQTKSTDPTLKELQKITFAKGAAATLLYRQVLNHPLKPGEREAIFTLGFLLQLINDAFDVYKDSQNKQHTMVTLSSSITGLYDLFQRNESKFLSQWSKLEYEKSKVIKSLKQISVVLGRGHVCFRQLIQLEHTTNDAFILNKYNRKQLICDMEKPKNIIRSVEHSTKILRRFRELLRS